MHLSDAVSAVEEDYRDARPLFPGPERVLAAGRVGHFAVVFLAEVDEEDVFYSQLVVLRREPAGWLELGAAGGRRKLDTTPWTPPPDEEYGVFITDMTSIDTEDEDGVESVVRAVGGFGASNTSALEVLRPEGTVTLRLSGPTKPFALVAVDEDPVTFTALVGERRLHPLSW